MFLFNNLIYLKTSNTAALAPAGAPGCARQRWLYTARSAGSRPAAARSPLSQPADRVFHFRRKPQQHTRPFGRLSARRARSGRHFPPRAHFYHFCAHY